VTLPPAHPPQRDENDVRASGASIPTGTRWQIKVLFDGECPLCRREIDFLRRRDGGRGLVAFEDITAPGFDAARHGIEFTALMGRIHGILPDGGIVDGVEVFRRLYAAVGLGWILAPTRWPVLRPLADAAYRWFARHRLRITGRADAACESNRCAASSGPGTPGMR
jgi:predicted DCC family thiol-disulfide oxidoreductase YuxK